MRPFLGLLALGIFTAGAVNAPEVTYSEHIEPILKEKCVGCHYPGGPGPFSIRSYAEAKRHSPLIRYTGILHEMPPTDAISEMGSLVVYKPLDDDELQDIQYWILDGMPEGNSTEPLEFTPPDWRVRADQVLRSVRPPKVNSEGAPYREIVTFDPKLDRPRYLVGFDVKPLQPKSVRHVLLTHADKTNPFGPLGVNEKALVGSWALGGHPNLGYGGILIQPGERLVAQVLYQPSGKPENGDLEVALQWADDAPASSWKKMGVRDFVIPTWDGIFNFSDLYTLSEDTWVSALHPEMRKYAIQTALTAKLPDGTTKNLFSILTWDPNWVGAYNFAKPVFLPKGTVLKATVTYDNSGCTFGVLRNIARDVKWGPGPEDELFWMNVLLTPATPQ